MTKSSPVSLTATVDGAADNPANDLPQREEFHYQDCRITSGRAFEYFLQQNL